MTEPIDNQGRLFEFIEYVPMGAVLLDVRGRYVRANSAFCALLGFSENELTGKECGKEKAEKHDGISEMLRGWLASGEKTLRFQREFRHRDGHGVWLDVHCSLIPEPTGSSPLVMAVFPDISPYKQMEGELSLLFDSDTLTGLFNRNRFIQELDRQLNLGRRYGWGWALLYIDLDHFTYINIGHGHHIGDAVLATIAQRIKRSVRATDVVARLGPDKFAVLAMQTNVSLAAAAAQRILAAINEDIELIPGKLIRVTASIGLVNGENKGTAEDLVIHSELAANMAKSNGGNQFYASSNDETLYALVKSRRDWEQRILAALQNGHFILHYQPILNLRTGEVDCFEALIRMRTEDGKLLLPGAFLATAESSGLITDIDHWVVSTAIDALSRFTSHGLDVGLFVNLSAKTFSDGGFLGFVEKRLGEAPGVDPKRLAFEITETAAISSFREARELIGALRDLGCRFSLDDFGAGYSSFSVLKQLPVDFLKIDGSFIKNIADDAADRHIVRAIVRTSKALAKKSVGEFVEDERVLTVLRRSGVDYAQGFLIGVPQTESDIIRLMASLAEKRNTVRQDNPSL